MADGDQIHYLLPILEAPPIKKPPVLDPSRLRVFPGESQESSACQVLHTALSSPLIYLLTPPKPYPSTKLRAPRASKTYATIPLFWLWI